MSCIYFNVHTLFETKCESPALNFIGERKFQIPFRSILLVVASDGDLPPKWWRREIILEKKDNFGRRGFISTLARISLEMGKLFVWLGWQHSNYFAPPPLLLLTHALFCLRVGGGVVKEPIGIQLSMKI